MKHAYMIDMIQWDFKPKPLNLRAHPDVPLPIEDKPDYLITKPGVDYQALVNSSLVTVNGFTHRLLYSENGMIIQEGFKTALAFQEINLGLMCFEQLGGLDIHDITDKNLIQPIEDLNPYNVLYLHFPKVNLDNKNIAISLGGYLHFIHDESSLVRYVGSNTLRIDMFAWGYMDRIKHLVKTFKDDKFGMTDYDDDRFDHTEIKSLKTLKALLNMSQSFLVVFKSKVPFQFKKEHVNRMNYPKRYWRARNDQEIFRLGDGRYPAYFYRSDNPEYIIRTTDNLKYYKFDDTAETDNERFVSDYNRTTVDPTIMTGTMIDIFIP